MADNLKPKLEIPDSNIEHPHQAKEVVVTLLFDTPFSKEYESQFGDGTYMSYTYTVLPEHSKEEHIWFVNQTLYTKITETGALAGDKIGVTRWKVGAADKDVRWSVVMKEKLSTSTPTRRPALDRGSELVVGGAAKTYQPKSSNYPTSHDVDEVVLLGLQFFVEAHKQVLGTLAVDPFYEDLSEDQRASLATATIINGIHSFRAGNRPLFDEPVLDNLSSAQEQFLDIVKLNLNSTDDGVARAVLASVCEMYKLEPTTVGAEFKAIGLSSSELDENVAATWLPFHAVAETMSKKPPEQDSLPF